MKVTSKGQVTIPQKTRLDLGIHPAETEVEFVQDVSGRWYLQKIRGAQRHSRFRRAHKAGQLRMNSDQILALTRGR